MSRQENQFYVTTFLFKHHIVLILCFLGRLSLNWRFNFSRKESFYNALVEYSKFLVFNETVGC